MYWPFTFGGGAASYDDSGSIIGAGNSVIGSCDNWAPCTMTQPSGGGGGGIVRGGYFTYSSNGSSLTPNVNSYYSGAGQGGSILTYGLLGGAGGNYDRSFDYGANTREAQDRRSSDLGFSDIRLKENIQPIENALDKVSIVAPGAFCTKISPGLPFLKVYKTRSTASSKVIMKRVILGSVSVSSLFC